jgi:hypothetical protein
MDGQDTGIERPIFVVGPGRAGSTLLYRLLCRHPDLVWFSSLTTRFPRYPSLAAFNRLYPIRQTSGKAPFARFIPAPSEGYEVWDYCKPVENSPSDPPLTASDVDEDEVTRLIRVIRGHIQAQGGTRFINKNTRNTRRLEYLHAIFPDALFIHIIRDPRATISSLLKVDWWPDLQIWCEGNITPHEWSRQGKDEAELAAALWRAETEYILDRRGGLDSQYMMVTYEELIENPRSVLESILGFCGLEWSDRVARFVHPQDITSMNYKFRQSLSGEQISLIESLSSPVLRRLGREYF